MADKHEIEIDIDDNGNVSFRVKGVKGKKCLEITKELEAALGIVVKQEKTAEFYQTDTQVGTSVETKGN
jgi:hypothetical protein